MQPLLDSRSAARLVGVSVRTLERYRLAGTGPRFSKLGRLVRYRSSDLETWVQLNICDSTSASNPPSELLRG
jgi:predicted DNA-binding transcriptional regulator AlpA